MPDDRTLERWLERGLEAIGALTKQVARVANAVEVLAVSNFQPNAVELDPCRACYSQLVPKAVMACPACGAQKEQKANG